MAKVTFIFEDDADTGQVNFRAEFEPELDAEEDAGTGAQMLAGVAFAAVTDYIAGDSSGCSGSCGDCACK